MGMQQHSEQDQPNEEQIVPVHRAQLHAQSYLGDLDAAQHLGGGPSPDPHATQQMQAVQRGEQVEEGSRWIIRYKITRGVQLLPRPKLSGKKRKRENARGDEADSHIVY